MAQRRVAARPRAANPVDRRPSAPRKGKSAKAGEPLAPAPAPAPVPVGPSIELPPELAAELQAAEGEAAGGGGTVLGAGAIAQLLLEIAALLELTGENVFKVRAYENAARALAGLGEDLSSLLERGGLQEVRGIGSSICEKVEILARTGRLEYYEQLKSRVPLGLLEMMRIPGLGPKRARALHDQLGITSVDELESACRAGRLSDARGFGEKTAQNILTGLEHLRRVQGRFLWSYAFAHVQPVLEALRAHPAVLRAEIAGSLRRRKETVADVDILVATGDPDAVMRFFVEGPWTARVLGSGETKTSVVHPFGFQMDLRAVTSQQYPYALHHFTGGKEHNVAMRGRAQRLGFKMNEYGLFHGDELVPCASEAEIFAALGLEHIPPELREDRGEIEAAEHGQLPTDLLEPRDLKGAFHVHTLYSDGRASLDDMVRGARDLGWQYVGISDHSQTAVYARGLRPERVLEQRRDIERLRRELPDIRILHGIESDILADGSLDYPDEILRQFDFVIAAVHSAFRLGRDEQTRRLLRALENPYTTILGHPTGRILLRRAGYEIDLPAVLDAAAQHGVAVEINAHPSRLDLDGAAAKQARDKGALLAIDPDAHSVDGLADLQYGVATARRAWLEPRHVLNSRNAGEVEAWLQARRARAASA